MHIYLVGGAVRDSLLARMRQDGATTTQHDRDWVVVGSTPQELLQQGYQPVGHDFPVFLHPVTREEYALARTERKSGQGHKGFTFHTSPDTTLEEDLARRDLTINAMAWPLADLQALWAPPSSNDIAPLIDPYGGYADLQAGLLRHITPAFEEDPLRVLRVARFAARWPSFHLAPETSALLSQMVKRGELKHLVPERVWQELSKGLEAQQPSRMLQVLFNCGAWSDLLHPMPVSPVAQAAVDRLAQESAPLTARFAALWWQAPAGALEHFCQNHRIPNHCASVAAVVLRGWPQWVALLNGEASAVWSVLQISDAFRRPERLAEAISCWTAWSVTGQLTGQDPAENARKRLLHALQMALDTRLPPSTQLLPGPAWGAALAQAREHAAVRAWATPGGQASN